jgi:tryptophan synthase beta chain
MKGFQLLAATEGIVPALEPAHAIGWLAREAGQSVPTGSTVLVPSSGPRAEASRPGPSPGR